MPVYFHISRYLKANSLTVFGGSTSLRPPSKWIPQNQFFELLRLGCQCFLLSVDISDTNILTWFGGIAPLGIPKTNSLSDLIYSASVFDISTRYFGDDYFDIVWGAAPPGTPKTQFFDCLKLGSIFFTISPYIRGECFDIIWEYPPPRGHPPKMTLHLLIFCLAQTKTPVLLFDINRYNRQIFRHSLRLPPYLGPPKWTPKNQIFARPNLRCLCF